MTPDTKKPLSVSIITVCLNCHKELQETLFSVFDQDYTNREIIVIDGGSTDETVNYLNKIRDRLKVFVSEPDKGIYHAMNKGIILANGDYIIFLNAGDRFASNNVLSIVFQNREIIDKKYEIISGRIQYEINGRKMNIFRPIKPGKEGLGLPHQATFIKTDLQKRNLFDTHYRYVADFELWQRLKMLGSYNVKYIDTIVSIFSIGGASTTTRNDMKRYLERAFVQYQYTNRFDIKDWIAIMYKTGTRKLLFSGLGAFVFFHLLRTYKRLSS